MVKSLKYWYGRETTLTVGEIEYKGKVMREEVFPSSLSRHQSEETPYDNRFFVKGPVSFGDSSSIPGSEVKSTRNYYFLTDDGKKIGISKKTVIGRGSNEKRTLELKLNAPIALIH